MVLSGGGIKAAAYHIGVCIALKEKGFKFSGGMKSSLGEVVKEEPMTIQLYVGSSAGAFVASILAAGFSVESLVNAFQAGSGAKPRFKKAASNALKPISYRHLFAMNAPEYFRFLPRSLRQTSLITGGLEAFVKNGFKLNGVFSTSGIERYLRKYVFVQNDFSNLRPELYIISTQLNHKRKAIFGKFQENYKTSTTEYINNSTISEAVACSTALPPIFTPYGLNRGEKTLYYYDGEIRETLSSHVAADHGCDLVISSYSMQPYHFTETVGSLHEYGIPVIINQALYQLLEQKISKHIDWQDQLKQIYKLIDGFFKQNNLPEDQRQKILEIFQSRFNYRPDVDYIYLTPRDHNNDLFFADHFSLNPKTLEKIIGIGFRSAIHVLRRHGL